MFKVSGFEGKQFRAFLSVSDTEYIDVILSKNSAVFISNTTEVFSMFVSEAESSSDESDFYFRVKRKLLLNLQTDGGFFICGFGENNSSVRLSFINTQGVIKYAAEFERLPVFNSTYMGKVHLLRKFVPDEFVDLSEMKDLIKLGKFHNALLNVGLNAACVLLNAGLRVCQTIKTTKSFCISCKSASILQKCSSSVFFVEDYACAYKDGFTVMVRLSRSYSNEEFYSITDPNGVYKSMCITEIDLSSVLSFITLEKMKTDFITVSLEHNNCQLKDNQILYIIPVTLTETRISPGAVITEIKLPYLILASVFNFLSITNFELRIKKNLTQIQSGDYYVLFN